VSEEPTTAVVQRYLDALAGDASAEPMVRELLDRTVHRLGGYGPERTGGGGKENDRGIRPGFRPEGHQVARPGRLDLRRAPPRADTMILPD